MRYSNNDIIMNEKNVLTTIFATSVVVANITAAKLVFIDVLWGISVPAGFVAIGVAFLCSDFLSERYGEQEARAVVNATIIALVVGWALIYVSLLLPTAPFYDDTAFNAVMGSSSSIVIAGIVSMIVSQNIDVTVFHYLRSNTDEWWFVRNIGSTAVSQCVDTVLFIGLAFVVIPYIIGGTVFPVVVAFQLFVGQYMVKLLVAIIDTPLFYTAISDTEQ